MHPIDSSVPATGRIEVSLGSDGEIDPDGPVSGRIELGIGGIRSGNPLIDREAERRLQVRRYPTVVGTLTALSPTATPGTYEGRGDLEFHGVTRPITGDLRITVDDDGELHLDGSTQIDVTDFDVQPPSLLVIKVHAQVRIDLHAVALPGG